MRRAGCAATWSAAATKYAADFRLISPRGHVVGARLQTERPLIVFQAAGERGVITKTHERPREIFCVQDGVANSRVDKRRPITEGAVDVVRIIPSGVPRTESLLCVSDERSHMH